MQTKLFYLFSLLSISSIIAQSDLNILSSTQSSLTIEYIPTYLDTTEIMINNKSFFKIDFSGKALSSIDNNSISVKGILIGVPNEFGNTIQIISEKYSYLKGELAPKPVYKKEGDFLVEYFSEDLSVNENTNSVVQFDEYGLVRNLPIQKIKVFPLSNNMQTNEIKLLQRLLFRIDFAAPLGGRVAVDNNIAEDIILNFNIAKNWGLPHKSKLSKKSNDFSLFDGELYRITIEEDGIYKIDKDKLKSYGIDPSTVDPRTIKIFNNGGYILNENVEEKYPSTPVENSIYIAGQDDGQFNDDDYILFYARGTNFWEYNQTKKRIIRNKNWYSNKNYYWISSGGKQGKRSGKITTSNSNSYIEQNKTLAHIGFDEDKVNLLKSGKTYVGRKFTSSENSFLYENELTGLVSNTKINYRFGFIKYSHSTEAEAFLNIEENGVNVFSTKFGQISPKNYRLGNSMYSTANYSGLIPDNNSKLKFIFNSYSSEIQGYIDYYEIEYTRNLNVSDELLFFSEDTTETIEFIITSSSGNTIEVFDITESNNINRLELFNNNNEFKFKIDQHKNKVSKFYAITSGNYQISPEGQKVELNGLSFLEENKNIIICPQVFRDAAERLAKYRKSHLSFPISTKVYFVEDIFNIFGSGIYDPTAIRNFLNYAYTNWSTKPEYVLLFGGGTYDILNVEGKNNNFIPTYQTSEFLHEYNSFPIEDYFSRISGNDFSADIAMGRLPVQTLKEANTVVDKIIYYETKSEKGPWRNNFTLVADDAVITDGPDPAKHVSPSEIIAETTLPEYMTKSKIYLSEYSAVITGSGRRIPSVNEKIIREINDGTLVINYIGHSAKTLWAHENVFVMATDFTKLKNDNYCFLYSASCEFGRFDDPEFKSPPQKLLSMENAGIIGSITASRESTARQNNSLCNRFYKNLFSDPSKKMEPIGKAYMKTKAYRSDLNDERYNLFCDPALRLNFPTLTASIDSINGKVPSDGLQIKALSNVEIKGSVLNEDNSVNTNFNGEAIITLFDSEKEKYLSDVNTNIIVHGGLIFRGRSSVSNGKFSTSFVVPKDISYENNNGKAVVYLYNNSNDGAAFTNNFIVGGTDSNSVTDNDGPEMDILFDSESSITSYLVKPAFDMELRLEDESGINTTGVGIGHKIEGIINDEDINSIDFTPYFEGDIDAGGKRGKIKYSFTDLKKGDYNIRFKAWDVYNNPTIEDRYFTVVDAEEIVIRDVYNYPNPFADKTSFTFQHNISEAIDVKIKIYTIAGRLIKEIESNDVISKFVKIYWNGMDEDGNNIANGTYLYKLIVKDKTGNFSNTTLGKLAVLK